MKLAFAARCLLILIGGVYSALMGWTHWLAGKADDADALKRALVWEQRLKMPFGRTAMQLADLVPSDETNYLRIAADASPPEPDPLVRLSLIDEFAGRGESAYRWMDRALAVSRTYKTFLAAASQASRLEDETRLLPLAALALGHCPRDADDVFHLLAKTARGDSVLEGAPTRFREDFLRYLIGRQNYLDALEYQAKLGPSEFVRRMRLELAERLLIGHYWDEAERLHPEPHRGGLQNSRFESQPSSLGFDWRLAKKDGLAIAWHPGELRFQLKSSLGSVELLSQYVRSSGPKEPRIASTWLGDVSGLRWQGERVHDKWVRIALIAEAKRAGEFRIQEVRLDE